MAQEVPAAAARKGEAVKRKILELPKCVCVCGFVCCLELRTCCCRVGSHPRRIPEFGLEAGLFWELLLHPERNSEKDSLPIAYISSYNCNVHVIRSDICILEWRRCQATCTRRRRRRRSCPQPQPNMTGLNSTTPYSLMKL